MRVYHAQVAELTWRTHAVLGNDFEHHYLCHIVLGKAVDVLSLLRGVETHVRNGVSACEDMCE